MVIVINGDGTRWQLDQKAIGLVSNGSAGGWTNWYLDQQLLGPSGNGLCDGWSNGIEPNGLDPVVTVTNRALYYWTWSQVQADVV